MASFVPTFDFRTTFRWLFVAVLAGFGFTVAGLWTQGYASIFVALLWAMACLAGGGAIGFLFGIPRVLQQGDAVSSVPTEDADGEPNESGYRMLVNTNLEQISDWLTKIIVGVGLIQLHELPDLLSSAAAFVATGTNATASHTMALLIYFIVLGFLCGYLMTRLYLAGAFARADTSIRVGGESLSPLEAVRQLANLVPDFLGRGGQQPDQVEVLPAPGDETSLDDDPFVGERRPDSEGQRYPRATAPIPVTPTDKLPILWVDDNPTNNSFIIEHLQRAGTLVEKARSTREALRLLDSHPFQRVVTDMGRMEGAQMNRTAGLDLIRAIRERDPKIPITVFTSVRGVSEHRARALEAGADVVTSDTHTLLQVLAVDRPR